MWIPCYSSLTSIKEKLYLDMHFIIPFVQRVESSTRWKLFSLTPDLAMRTAKGQMLTSAHNNKGRQSIHSLSLGSMHQIINFKKIVVSAFIQSMCPWCKAEEGHPTLLGLSGFPFSLLKWDYSRESNTNTPCSKVLVLCLSAAVSLLWTFPALSVQLCRAHFYLVCIF